MATDMNSTALRIMKRHPLKWALLAAATLTSVTCATKTQAQSVDALLDKLVDKGVLTTKEANELKEETDRGFTKDHLWLRCSEHRAR